MAVAEIAKDMASFSVKLTGVPRDATESDVRQFFYDCVPSDVSIFDGGNVLVKFDSLKDFEMACLKDGYQLRWTKVGVLPMSSEQSVSSSLKDKVDKCDTNKEEDKDDESQYNVIRMRGLPYSATALDVLNFLKDVTVDNGEKGIHFSSGSHGRSTGEVFVEVCSSADVSDAMKYDREHMGGRYIEIFRSSRAQLEWECRGAEKSGGSGGVVRLRGLPYGCSADDLRDFLKGIAIVENGITVQTDETGKETGEAFIEVETNKDVEKALDRHKKSIGHRYIEVFRTTKGDIKPVSSRWASYSRPSPYPQRTRGFDEPRCGRGRGRGNDYTSSYSNTYNQYGQYEDTHDHGSNHLGGGRNITDCSAVSYPPIRSSDAPQYGVNAGKHAVRMRGLPFSVTVRDIQNFFAPLIPINIVIERDDSGRLSGEGEVSFGTHEDALEAMQKDRSHIGVRYIELFLHSRNTNQTTLSQSSYSGSSWSSDSVFGSYQDPSSQFQDHSQQHRYINSYQQPSFNYNYQTGVPPTQQPAYTSQRQHGLVSDGNNYSQIHYTNSGYGYSIQQQRSNESHVAKSGPKCTKSWY